MADLESRKTIYNLVKEHAGLHLREIQRRSGLALSVTRYHLEYLKRNHLVKEEHDKRNMRYYPLSFSSEDMQIMNILRQSTPRAIVTLLLSKHCSLKTLQEELRLSESTVSENVQELKKKNIVKKNKDIYELSDERKIAKILITYKRSFFDSLVDRVIESWEF